jgi:hypothetical protein
MNERPYGVFFRDQGAAEYLFAVTDGEARAWEDAGERDRHAFEVAVKEHSVSQLDARSLRGRTTTVCSTSSPSRTSLRTTLATDWSVASQ